MFGWGDFRGDGKHRGEKLSGKHCFPLFGKERKIGRVENPGENSLPGPQISSPQIGKKWLSGKLMKNTLSIMPSGIKLKKRKRKKRESTGE